MRDEAPTRVAGRSAPAVSKVSARFHSAEAAEIASRFMRAHLEGVDRISVVSRRRAADVKVNYNRGFLNMAEGGRHDVGGAVRRREAYLSVTTAGDSDEAVRLMRSLGGVEVKVNT